MQDNLDNELDLALRYALYDAEQRAPRRVRGAVLRHVRPRSAGAAWARPLAAVAAAGALALTAALTLPGLLRRTPSTPSQDTPALLADIPAAVSDPASGPRQDTPAVSPDLSLTQPTTETAPEATDGALAHMEATAAPSPADVRDRHDSPEVRSADNRGSSPKTYDDFVDPFAALEAQEVAARTRRIAITAGGQVGTNGSPSPSGMRGSVHAAPASSDRSSTSLIESGQSSYHIPVSLGLGVRVYLTDRWAVGSGITYSRLSRSFEGRYIKTNAAGVTVKNETYDVTGIQHYIGIPLTVSCDILDNKSVSLYGFAGGSVEKGLGYRFRIPSEQDITGSISGVQASVSAGFGLGFRITDRVNLFIDPSLVYYFDCDQPKSIRTQQRLQGLFSAGLRFDINGGSSR